MLNSQHSTEGKMHKSRERGFQGMREQCFLLVGGRVMQDTGRVQLSASPVYISDLTLLHSPLERQPLGFLLCASPFLLFP